jgi:hypothetical protein
MIISTVEKQYSETLEGVIFTNYKLILENGKEIIVPLDEANTDYQEIQQWIADGGTVIDNPPEETP